MPLLPIVASIINVTQDATVVCQKFDSQYRVISANKSAKNGGIRLNMDLSTIQALLPEVNILNRDIPSEQFLIEKFANIATSWSPNVAIQNDHILLIEIGNCLRLHGGLRALLRLVHKSLPCKTLDCNISVTPTPMSAILCALANYNICITDHAQLVSHIGDISVDTMNITKQHKKLLKQLGISQINELLRLPRDDLIRRTDQNFLNELDQLIGKTKNPKSFYHPPLCFKESVDFEEPMYEIEQLLRAVKRLLMKLQQFLQRSCSAVEYLEWDLLDDYHSCTHVPIRLDQPKQRVTSLINLSQFALESSPLKGGVTQLTLNVNSILLLQSKNTSFLSIGESYEPDQLLDRLSIRLGYHAINGICCQPNHSPEHAWTNCQPGITKPIYPSASRPLWLFSSPRPLSMKNGQPIFHGSLELSRHERIVTNWWCKQSIQRDYYQAKSSRGLIWIFRELQTKAWYIHGIF